jgi:hypothetical protein
MGMSDDRYLKDWDHTGQSHSRYWINPKITDLTDAVLLFCGPICSNAWYEKARGT